MIQIGSPARSMRARGYLGLVPWLDEGADLTHLGHITKKGSGGTWWCERVAVRKDEHLREFYTSSLPTRLSSLGVSKASKFRVYGFLEENRDRNDIRHEIARLEE